MHTLTVTLKQHTPLIHFQHDQEGATLRASEVKPRLDKFVLSKLTLEEKESGEREGWIKDKNGKTWLDYRLRVYAEGINEPVDPNEFVRYKSNGKPEYKKSPMFFANIGDKTEKKYYTLCDKCKLTFFTSSLMLRDRLAEFVGDFFIRNNFGTRQSKGYGSFSLTSSSPKTIVHSKNLLFFSVYGDREMLFEEMEWFHKALRGGINDCFGKRLYFKSLMFSFAKNIKEQQWEKKTIKQCYYPRILEQQMDDHKKSDLLLYKNNHYDTNDVHYSFRDCLGLSSLEQWKKPYNKTIKKENATIERFKSPITLKPVFIEKENRWKVYVIWEELPTEYLGAKFKVTSNDIGDLKLTIPPDFSIKEYFDYLFKKNGDGSFSVDIRSLFLVKDNVSKMNEMIRIFDELRSNYNL